MDCLLCRGSHAAPFERLNAKQYFRCGDCQLIFLDPTQMPAPDTEESHSEHHPTDINYRSLLRHLAVPLTKQLKPGSYGLDYGCGPEPVLAEMLSERGFAMEVYDPVYANDEDVLEETYDFITCAEVIEHFHFPAQEFEQFDQMLTPGGCLAMIINWLTDDINFAHWDYRHNPAHVCFYSAETLGQWTKNKGWRISFPEENIAFLHKPLDPVEASIRARSSLSKR